MTNSKGVEKLLETIKRSSEHLQELSAKSDAALQKNEKLATETALGRPQRKSALEDFVDDLVHRPPNAEQIRQLKEAILAEQKILSQILELLEKWQSQESVTDEKSVKNS
ncbi:hypothetical protein [Microseira wollei]|uniref:Uncharacterized protein n=1 Tax=Microseira wollei NIES-4236 TaxID=2530354 RepID=A0AAV3XE91_9CYAN|nr:hypothetical protein [Microseira wollei]GET41252.1 hypothetical protein MiSe_60640 [Microseira wollei NIES-4236]